MAANHTTQMLREVFLCLLNTVFLALVVSRVEALPMSELFPFGSSNGDSRVPTADDSSSGPVSIAVNFPFFGNHFTKIYVNTNGGVSFQRSLLTYTPEDFPLQNTSTPVITGYWSDVDTYNGGTIWYRQETGQALLDKATNAIRLGNLKIDWLFVATWDKVAFFGAWSSGRNKRNTFQVVLALDSSSEMSFVLLNYNRLEWTCGTLSGHCDRDTGRGGSPALAGFDAGDHVNFYKIPGSKTPAVLNLVNTSNMGVPGRYIFKIDSAHIQSVTAPPPTTPPTTPPINPLNHPAHHPDRNHYPIMFPCETGPNAADFYTYPSDPALYIHCEAGQAYLLKCPAGTQWDQSLLRCQAPNAWQVG